MMDNYAKNSGYFLIRLRSDENTPPIDNEKIRKWFVFNIEYSIRHS